MWTDASAAVPNLIRAPYRVLVLYGMCAHLYVRRARCVPVVHLCRACWSPPSAPSPPGLVDSSAVWDVCVCANTLQSLQHPGELRV